MNEIWHTTGEPNYAVLVIVIGKENRIIQYTTQRPLFVVCFLKFGVLPLVFGGCLYCLSLSFWLLPDLAGKKTGCFGLK